MLNKQGGLLADTAGAAKWCDFGDSRKYCDHGCCGDVCCTVEIWLIVAIIGGVFGGILLISFAICLFCVFVKHNVKPGRVIHPAPGNHAFSICKFYFHFMIFFAIWV